MDKLITVFGYGSLINEESLRKTVPLATHIRLAKVNGFSRVFNAPNTWRVDSKRNIPTCALNVVKDPTGIVNGICFDVCEQGFEELKKREEGYVALQVDAYLYETHQAHSVYMFISHKEYPFVFDSKEQQGYVEMCIDGCKRFGEEFVNEFRKTTFIGDKTLSDLDL